MKTLILSVFLFFSMISISGADVPVDAKAPVHEAIIPPGFANWTPAQKNRLIRQRIQEVAILDKQLGKVLDDIDRIGNELLKNLCNYKEIKIRKAIQMARLDVSQKKAQLKTEKHNKKNLLQAINVSESVLKELEVRFYKRKKSAKCEKWNNN